MSSNEPNNVVAEEENDETRLVDIMDVDDEKSVGSDGAIYGIYER
eukprot:CAMPEP_0197823888 /NCGR_PEP_ID=MMETSP1437-20131217/1203_1 /TAXON_ID=49252 ORGANISM="Eucampia antarctica, Strain CCMP1452" /NCGR_SAMPLE_ID=MMETSP1437 /ASSEMBLY_ACC=CAM_ASM_001096 /LENGTH=44 /DNA_ID= /DNA_START= /DNA_END= /DNA_ORIENTATION=